MNFFSQTLCLITLIFSPINFRFPPVRRKVTVAYLSEFISNYTLWVLIVDFLRVESILEVLTY